MFLMYYVDSQAATVPVPGDINRRVRGSPLHRALRRGCQEHRVRGDRLVWCHSGLWRWLVTNSELYFFNCHLDFQEIIEEMETIDDEVDSMGIALVTTEVNIECDIIFVVNIFLFV